MTLDQFQAVLDQITVQDILRAAADYLDDRGSDSAFQSPRGWSLVIAGHSLAHRPIIAAAAARHIGRELTPDDFTGNNDKRSKWWLEQLNFQTANL
jgi:hypothetical protein